MAKNIIAHVNIKHVLVETLFYRTEHTGTNIILRYNLKYIFCTSLDNKVDLEINIIPSGVTVRISSYLFFSLVQNGHLLILFTRTYFILFIIANKMEFKLYHNMKPIFEKTDAISHLPLILLSVMCIIFECEKIIYLYKYLIK